MSKDINKTDKQGRKQGHWVERFADGGVLDGTVMHDTWRNREIEKVE